MIDRRRWLLLVGLALVSACADAGPVSGPGTITVAVVSPNGPEGAAVVTVLGDGLGSPTALVGIEVHGHQATGSTRIVLIHPTGGDLVFQMAVADTTGLPDFLLQEVAGPDDELRSDLSGYRVEVVR